MRARNPYDEPVEAYEIQGFLPFGYDTVAPNGAQNDMKGTGLFNVNLGGAKDFVFRNQITLYPNNEILRRFAPQNDIKRETSLLNFILCLSN